MINSRRKGKNGELQFCRLLQAHGYQARRAQQYKGTETSQDIDCPGPIAWEVKFREQMVLARVVEQARNEAPAHRVAAVAHRKKRQRWLVTLDAEDFLRLIKDLTSASSFLGRR